MASSSLPTNTRRRGPETAARQPSGQRKVIYANGNSGQRNNIIIVEIEKLLQVEKLKITEEWKIKCIENNCTNLYKNRFVLAIANASYPRNFGSGSFGMLFKLGKTDSPSIPTRHNHRSKDSFKRLFEFTLLPFH